MTRRPNSDMCADERLTAEPRHWRSDSGAARSEAAAARRALAEGRITLAPRAGGWVLVTMGKNGALTEAPLLDPEGARIAPWDKGGLSRWMRDRDRVAAGGAESWARSPSLREAMLGPVERARAPILFIQAANDYDLSPSRTLHAAARARGRPAEIRIYPAFGASARDGHAFAYRAVPRWHGDAMAHLEGNCRG